MENTVEIKINEALAVYRNADEGGKELLEKLCGKDIFKPKDIMERVKTFDDAYNELGKGHPLIIEYEAMMNAQGYTPSLFMIAAMKLSIICAALNEGWKPQFTEDEWRYYPWFWLYTKEEYERMSDKQKQNCVDFGGIASYGAYDGLVSAYAASAPSSAYAHIGSRLCLKSDALAVYCGNQFIEIWKDYLL